MMLPTLRTLSQYGRMWQTLRSGCFISGIGDQVRDKDVHYPVDMSLPLVFMLKYMNPKIL
jgi:hypothetical protein